MRIAILGAGGVVGGFLAQALSSKYVVTPVTRQVVNLLDTHAVIEFFNNNKFDVVINTAVNPNSRLDASTQVAVDNLTTFANVYACRDSYGRMLQFCSGAEFDRRNSLDNVREEALFTSMPIDPYGLSKNTVARIAVSTDNFYNIRLFGVFYPIEFPGRLLPKILSNQPVNLEDKYFDYLYLEDLLPLVEYYINNAVPKYKDINVVYPEKMLLSEFVKQFCVIHNLEGANITFGSTTPFNYSGNADKFDSLNLPRIGLEAGMKKYK